MNAAASSPHSWVPKPSLQVVDGGSNKLTTLGKMVNDKSTLTVFGAVMDGKKWSLSHASAPHFEPHDQAQAAILATLVKATATLRCCSVLWEVKVNNGTISPSAVVLYQQKQVTIPASSSLQPPAFSGGSFCDQGSAWCA